MANCRNCKAEILETTSRKNDGLCKPCLDKLGRRYYLSDGTTLGEVIDVLKNSKPSDRLEGLVRRLLFYRDEPTVLDALREATTLAREGDYLGVEALSIAIRRRCGNRPIKFYSPPSGALTIRSGEDLMEAENRLFQLAESHRLLDDPEATQNIMSAANTFSPDGLDSLIRKIFTLVGNEHGYDFQLLYNQMWSSIQIRHARGERSWTETVETYRDADRPLETKNLRDSVDKETSLPTVHKNEDAKKELFPKRRGMQTKFILMVFMLVIFCVIAGFVATINFF